MHERLASIRNVVLDTTYLLPVFGIDIDVDSSSTIQETLQRLRGKGVGLHISDLTPFEAFIKSYRISEKLRDDEGKEAARSGLVILARADWVSKVDHKEDTVINEAFKVRLSHNDPFDCFIFATAKALEMPLVTEDDSASNFLDKDSILSWKELKRKLRA